jgi:transposase-like protein
MTNIIKNIISKYLTITKGSQDIPETREINTPPIREMNRPAADSFKCPYCFSTRFVRRGTRQKKLESVQLYLCNDCGKTFTPHLTKGKHYPLPTILDALAIYHLGYSLEQTCRIVNLRSANKRAPVSRSSSWRDHVSPVPNSQSENNMIIDSCQVAESGGHDPHPASRRDEVAIKHFPDLRDSLSIHKTSIANKTVNLQPSTLANWLTEFAELCRFSRMREFALKKYAPRDMVVTATLVHRQLYRYRFHRAKADLMIQEEYQHRKFTPVKEFLELVPSECPHQYFSEGSRASEVPLTFSKTQMIVRAKQNYATRMAAFVLQSVKDRKLRHEAIQKFMLACDSVTVATEVPVYITQDDLLHMQTQLGFEIVGDLPKLITGHIDILQIRNGQVHILDFKPKAEKEKPIEQLTLYAMALSRLTGLRLFEFKCAWFDEKDYFEFYPLHVLHKTKGAARRRNIVTKEGVYSVNLNPQKLEKVRPI